MLVRKKKSTRNQRQFFITIVTIFYRKISKEFPIRKASKVRMKRSYLTISAKNQANIFCGSDCWHLCDGDFTIKLQAHKHTRPHPHPQNHYTESQRASVRTAVYIRYIDVCGQAFICIGLSIFSVLLCEFILLFIIFVSSHWWKRNRTHSVRRLVPYMWTKEIVQQQRIINQTIRNKNQTTNEQRKVRREPKKQP